MRRPTQKLQQPEIRITLGNVLQAPLAIFATFVGVQGGYADGGLGRAFAGAVS